MTKPTFVIYINNLLAYSVFCILKLFFFKKNPKASDSILFINSGQIGDLIVSSILFDNEEKFSVKYNKIVILVKDDYQELYSSYQGTFIIKFYNYKKYKWNIIYKIKLLKELRELNLKYCFNLTAARGILNDEMAILSGAKETFALNSDWKYLKKIFGEKMDSFYKEIIGKESLNEYEKHFNVLKYLVTEPILSFTPNGNKILFHFNGSNKNIINAIKDKKKLIIIAPFSSEMNRDWPMDKLKKLIALLLPNKFEIILIGSESQKGELELIHPNNKQILILAGEIKLNEIPTLLNFSSLFIGLDSGLTHIALRLRIPTIAIIGGGMYGKFLPSPLSKENIKYLFADCDHFLCEWNCKYYEKKCLTNVPVNEVYTSILSLLRN